MKKLFLLMAPWMIVFVMCLMCSTIQSNAENGANETAAIVETIEAFPFEVEEPENVEILGPGYVHHIVLNTEPEFDINDFDIYYAQVNLNVRSDSNMESDILHTYAINDEVKVVEINGEWATINFNDEKAYVNTEFISTEKCPMHIWTFVENGREYTPDPVLQQMVYKYCQEFGIQGYEKTIMAQFWKESHFRSGTVSSTNDYGIAQINRCNHSRLRRELGITDFLDPEQSIKCGVYMMADHLRRNGFNESKALSQYNTGKPYNSTKYSRAVLSIRDTQMK